MMYATFQFYTDVYLGNVIAEEDFPRLSLRASAFLDYYTQNRAEDNIELPALKMACCAIAEQMQIAETATVLASSIMRKGEGGEVQSESVGSYSVTRRSGGDSAAAAVSAYKSAQSMFAETARQYLASTGLIYRGVRKCTRRTR